MSRSSRDDLSITISNSDNSTSNTSMENKNKEVAKLQPQKNNFWIGTLVGGASAVTVTTAILASYMILAAGRKPPSSNYTYNRCCY